MNEHVPADGARPDGAAEERRAPALVSAPTQNKTLALAEERKRRAQPANPCAYAICWLAARLLFRSFVRVEVSGLEQVPRRGPLLVVGNHLSYLEPPLLTSVLPRRITYLALHELFTIPWLSPIVRLMGALPVKRGGARDLDAIRAALHLLQEQQAVGIFPEGQRSIQAGLLRANPGVSLLALRSGAPVLPVAVTGTERLPALLPFVLARPRRVRIQVVVGAPFHPEVAGHRTNHQLVADQIMCHVAALLPPEYRGVYRGTM